MSLKMATSTANPPTITVNRNDEGLITPHGGELKDLIIKDDAAKQAAIDSCTTSLQLSDRQMCDVELIMNGGFSPLTGFMNQKEYEHVVENMRLTSGELFGLPVIFDSDDESLKVEDKYLPDKPKECLKCYGTSQLEHPGVVMVAMERGKYYFGGKIEGLNLPIRDFNCRTPKEVRSTLPK